MGPIRRVYLGEGSLQLIFCCRTRKTSKGIGSAGGNREQRRSVGKLPVLLEDVASG